MKIDWFTFFAQIFNFLLLVFLLKKVLYRPVLGAIDKREEGIRKRLEAADEAERAAEELRGALEGEAAELEAGRAVRVREIDQEIEGLRRRRTEEAQEQLRRMHGEWRDALKKQEEGFLSELTRRIAQEGFAVARRVLSDLADVELEAHVHRIFLQRLQASDPEALQPFADALRTSHGEALVISAFPLGEGSRNEIAHALEKWAGTPVHPEFREDPSLALGMELRAGDRKIAWSVESYLEALRDEVAVQLTPESG